MKLFIVCHFGKLVGESRRAPGFSSAISSSSSAFSFSLFPRRPTELATTFFPHSAAKKRRKRRRSFLLSSVAPNERTKLPSPSHRPLFSFRSEPPSLPPPPSPHTMRQRRRNGGGSFNSICYLLLLPPSLRGTPPSFLAKGGGWVRGGKIRSGKFGGETVFSGRRGLGRSLARSVLNLSQPRPNHCCLISGIDGGGGEGGVGHTYKKGGFPSFSSHDL